ncbi:Ldh family oxidoreductase [Leucobacter sp. BZR 635]
MEIPLAELTTRVTAKLTDLGAPAEEVAVAAEMCIDAELRAHRSHGVRLIRNIEREYRLGDTRRRPLSIEHETPTSAVVDGGYHLSPFVHREAVDLLTRKAQQSGIAVVSVRHAGVSGALGYLVERVARSGMCAIALNSTPLVVVAPGSTDPAIGTNPVGIAVPRESGDPLVLDMATSAIAFNEVMRLRTTGGTLPDGVALDEHGTPTTNPHDAVRPDGRGRVLPFGGHRGYGLALMIELLVSGFGTGRTAAAKRGPEVHEPDDFGAVYIAFDPALLGAGSAGPAAVETLLAEIVGGGGRLPGEHSREIRAARLSSGVVPLDDNACAVLGL